MFGAPPITVVLGEEAHSTIFAGLKYLGFGERNIVRVRGGSERRDDRGRIRGGDGEGVGPVIAIAQAGHINTGAFDPFGEMARVAQGEGCVAAYRWRVRPVGAGDANASASGRGH